MKENPVEYAPDDIEGGSAEEDPAKANEMKRQQKTSELKGSAGFQRHE